MEKAYCIKCGEEKKKPHCLCKGCKFKPIEESDIVKSVWLSSIRILSEEEVEFREYKQLERFSSRISTGESPIYPEHELKLLLSQYRTVQEKTIISPLWFGFAFFVIPLLAIFHYFLGSNKSLTSLVTLKKLRRPLVGISVSVGAVSTAMRWLGYVRSHRE